MKNPIVKRWMDIGCGTLDDIYPAQPGKLVAQNLIQPDTFLTQINKPEGKTHQEKTQEEIILPLKSGFPGSAQLNLAIHFFLATATSETPIGRPTRSTKTASNFSNQNSPKLPHRGNWKRSLPELLGNILLPNFR